MAEDLPTHLRGYVVSCEQCADPDLFHSLFYDVAERFAEQHEEARSHTTEVTERTQTPTPAKDLLYRVYCGDTNRLLDDVDRENVAVAIATAHEETHRCGAWWERPFDHIAFYAPNACDPPTPQG